MSKPRNSRARRQLPEPEDFDSEVQQANAESGFGERVFKERMRVQMTQHTLAKHLKKNRSSVAQWERGKNIPDIHTIEAMATLLNTSPQFLAFGISEEPRTVMPDPRQLGYALVPEIRVGNSPTDFMKIQDWGLPYQYLSSDLSCPDPTALMIVAVETDLDDYLIGDRVIVDRSATRPSPPGVFLIWDGMAPVLSKVSVVPGTTKQPHVRIENANGSFELPIDRAQLLGRVRGAFKRR